MAGSPVAVLVVFVFVAQLVHPPPVFFGEIVIHLFVQDRVAVLVTLIDSRDVLCPIGIQVIYTNDVSLFVARHDVYPLYAAVRVVCILGEFLDIVVVVI